MSDCSSFIALQQLNLSNYIFPVATIREFAQYAQYGLSRTARLAQSATDEERANQEGRGRRGKYCPSSTTIAVRLSSRYGGCHCVLCHFECLDCLSVGQIWRHGMRPQVPCGLPSHTCRELPSSCCERRS